jgi:ubiquinone biosynthesis protein
MDLVRTGIGITRTIKNVSRLREILSVFARNGFDEFLIQSNVQGLIPGFVLPKSRINKAISEFDEEGKDFWKTIGYRLRKSFEELGPSFIKVGQLLSSREDIFDPALIAELKLLQNKVQGIEFSEAKAIIEKNLEKPLDEVFESIEEKPIGTASIGIVYKAKLKNGEDVVVKVRRPNIKKILVTDFEIIAFIIGQLEKVSKDIRYLGVARAVDDFFKSIQLELNFLVEANNCKKMKQNLHEIDKDHIFKVPKIYMEYTSDEILTMEYLDGRPFVSIHNLREVDPNLEEKLIKSVRMFTHTMLADGFFHADLHGGNFFYMSDGTIGIIDFGLMGTLSKKNRTNLVAILFALVTNNYENLVYEFLDVADYEVIPAHEDLTRDIQDALAPHIGLNVQDLDATLLVNAIVTTLSKHQIYLPREWFIIFRALMTLDGVGKSVNINLNIFEIIDEEIYDIMDELVNKEAIIEDAVWLGRDVLNSVRVIPRHIRWVLKEFSRKKYAIDVNLNGIQRDIKLVSKSIYFAGMMFLASTLVFSGVFLVSGMNITEFDQVPIIAWIFWGLGFLTVFRATGFIRKK